MRVSGTSLLLAIWALSTAAGAAVLLAGMVYGGGVRARLVIGATTSGHHQIEPACDACHGTPFGGGPVLQSACLSCHAEELKQAKDTHPAKKFTDPRNADRLEKLDATHCVTCHREHKPEVTSTMGVTLPTDYCALCHSDIGRERPSHAGLAFGTCASSGCHNYHDNRALYADFLIKHAGEPDLKRAPVARLRLAVNEPAEPRTPLARADVDAPADKLTDAAAADWLASGHAKAGVNCSGCHGPGTQDGAAQAAKAARAWIAKPDHTVCATCHGDQATSFTQGRHGMRLAKGLMSSRAGLWGLFADRPLSPMRPELARLPMSKAAHGREIGCTSCHTAHRFDTGSGAQVEACLGCHADDHSKAYLGSPHHRLWQAEMAGTRPRGSGVSCATCHLPRHAVEDPDTGLDRVVVNHNQSYSLRPTEKMVREVCASCHGLPFTLDALADAELAARNFSGRPPVHVESIHWALKQKGQTPRLQGSD
jgi:hypothetical protein